MVEMKVYGLGVDEGSQVPVLLLKDLRETRALPIWIGAMEAMAISMALNNVALPRPMTHDLAVSLLGALGGRMLAAEIVSLREGTFFAELVVEHAGATRRVDCRPSDAVALALRAGAVVRVAEEVLEAAGMPADQAPQPQPQPSEDGEGEDPLLKILQDFDPSDKYKM